MLWVNSVMALERSRRPPVDDDDVVADAFELTEQVRGDQDADAELGADAPDQREHLVAALRVEAVGRLVEEDQLRVVDERLRELDALLHAGGVAADGAVALLVQADVAQHVGGALAGGGARQSGDLREVDDQPRSRKRRAAGSRARACSRHEGADLRAMGDDVEAEHLGPARRLGQEAEQDLDQRGLARSVGAHEAGDARFDRDGELVQRGHRGEALGQPLGREDVHDPDTTREARPAASFERTNRGLIPWGPDRALEVQHGRAGDGPCPRC
ncbi:hypothetical protein GCM10020219_038380 [Nonomuraea dietziae]